MVVADSGNYSLDVNGGSALCGSEILVLSFGQTCTVTITFTPNQEGLIEGTLTVNSDDPGLAALVVALLGTGVIPGSGGGCSLGAGSLPGNWAWLLGLGSLLVLRRLGRVNN